MIGYIEEIGEKIDPNQYGGAKGTSISHYLIDLLTFVHYNQDLKENYAVVAIFLDWEKAFNRQDHCKLITILSEMGLSGWLLNIVSGFLSDRYLVIRYKGAVSGKNQCLVVAQLALFWDYFYF